MYHQKRIVSCGVFHTTLQALFTWTVVLVRTDHEALKWLFNFKEPEGQVARWQEQLSAFNFKIEHRAGLKHGNSDGMSRRPYPDECKTCKKGVIVMIRESKEDKDRHESSTPLCKGRTGRT